MVPQRRGTQAVRFAALILGVIALLAVGVFLVIAVVETLTP